MNTTRSSTRQIVFCLLLVATTLLGPGDALAQGTDPTTAEQASAPATEQEISGLLATLRDPKARATLERQLELMLAAQADTDSHSKPAAAESVTELISAEIQGIWDKVSEISPRKWLEGGLLSASALLAALALYWLLRRFGRFLAGLVQGVGPQLETTEGFLDSIRPFLKLSLKLFILAALVLAIARIWGLQLADLLPGTILSNLAETGFSVLLVGLLAFIAWHAVEAAVHIVFNRLLAKEESSRRSQRVRTLEPLFVSVGRFTINTLVVLILLAELGVDIGPLLAGAGILGLAIGFGAQNLVRDLLNGVLIIVDDAASVGDVVEVAGHKGLIEAMNMRIMVLRDLTGVVHAVPYGDITTVMNFTKDFSYALVDAGVAYRENIGEVVGELEAIGARLRDDSEIGPKTLEDLEILGVDRLADSAVVIRVRMRCKADDRWTVERALRRAIKDGFDEAGIEIPFPHTTLYFGEGKSGEAAPARVRLANESSKG